MSITRRYEDFTDENVVDFLPFGDEDRYTVNTIVLFMKGRIKRDSVNPTNHNKTNGIRHIPPSPPTNPRPSQQARVNGDDGSITS